MSRLPPRNLPSMVVYSSWAFQEGVTHVCCSVATFQLAYPFQGATEHAPQGPCGVTGAAQVPHEGRASQVQNDSSRSRMATSCPGWRKQAVEQIIFLWFTQRNSCHANPFWFQMGKSDLSSLYHSENAAEEWKNKSESVYQLILFMPDTSVTKTLSFLHSPHPSWLII